MRWMGTGWVGDCVMREWIRGSSAIRVERGEGGGRRVERG